MSEQQIRKSENGARIARFNYLAGSIPHSLYRNGNVSLTRNPDGTDAEMVGYVGDAWEKEVRDARIAPEGTRGLHVNGFELRNEPLRHRDINFLSHVEARWLTYSHRERSE